MGDNPFTEEEYNTLASLSINEKARVEQTLFKQKPIDPEWQKYYDLVSGLLEKLKKMKD